MATTADIKIGMCIELDGKTFQIVDFQHVKPGKGPAFVRTKLKNLENGRVLDNTFSAGVKIEPVRVERRPYQFTYDTSSPTRMTWACTSCTRRPSRRSTSTRT